MVDEERFAASEKFFVEDYADGRVALRLALVAERIAACGASASAEFSLAMRLRRPGVCGSVFSSSRVAATDHPL
jgi:hypothetical protein